MLPLARGLLAGHSARRAAVPPSEAVFRDTENSTESFGRGAQLTADPGSSSNSRRRVSRVFGAGARAGRGATRNRRARQSELVNVAADARVARVMIDRPHSRLLDRTSTQLPTAAQRVRVNGKGVAWPSRSNPSWPDDLYLEKGRAARAHGFRDLPDGDRRWGHEQPHDEYGHGTHWTASRRQWLDRAAPYRHRPGAHLIGLKCSTRRPRYITTSSRDRHAISCGQTTTSHHHLSSVGRHHSYHRTRSPSPRAAHGDGISVVPPPARRRNATRNAGRRGSSRGQ